MTVFSSKAWNSLRPGVEKVFKDSYLTDPHAWFTTTGQPPQSKQQCIQCDSRQDAYQKAQAYKGMGVKVKHSGCWLIFEE